MICCNSLKLIFLKKRRVISFSTSKMLAVCYINPDGTSGCVLVPQDGTKYNLVKCIPNGTRLDGYVVIDDKTGKPGLKAQARLVAVCRKLGHLKAKVPEVEVEPRIVELTAQVAAGEARIAELTAQVAAGEARIAELEEFAIAAAEANENFAAILEKQGRTFPVSTIIEVDDEVDDDVDVEAGANAEHQETAAGGAGGALLPPPPAPTPSEAATISSSSSRRRRRRELPKLRT